MKMFRLKTPFGEADRGLPSQPEMFINPVDNTERCNGRKLSELPFHLIRCNRIQELYDKCLFHYDFMFAKLSCQPLNNLISDYEDLLSFKIDKEVILVSDALRLASSQLSISPTNLVPQLIGRLLPYYFIKNSRRIRNVKSLLDKCESDGLKNSALIPAFNCFHVPGGPLVFSLEGHPFAVYGISLMIDETQLLSVSNRFIIFDLSSGDLMRIINPGIEGIMQYLTVSYDSKYCISFSNNDQIIFFNIITSDTKILNRYSNNQQNFSFQIKNNNNKTTKKVQMSLQQPQQSKEYTDNFVGSFAGLFYFVVWSKYFYYVYDLKLRLIKYEKLKFPIIQIEIIDNLTIQNYGIELEMITRCEDCKDDDELERENLLLDYKLIIDPFRNHFNDETPNLDENEIAEMYVPSCSPIEIHSCAILTKNKKKLYTCTEIGDHVIECFRNRVDLFNSDENKIKNIWKYHGSLDDNLEQISGLILSLDEKYMLASVSWGFKVFYLLTGQSKPLRLPPGVKNIPIGYKKLHFPAVFSNENKFVIAGVRDNIYIWETSYGIYLKRLDAHYGRISSLVGSFNKTKNLVVSASMDKTIKIWNINNILEEDFILDHLEKPIETIQVSIEAEIAIAMTRNQLVLISLKDGKIKHSFCNSPHGAIFNCCALNTLGTILISSESSRLVIWNIDKRKPLFIGPTPQSVSIHIKQILMHQQDNLYVLCAYLDSSTRTVTIINHSIPDGESLYKIQYNLRFGTEFKEFIVTNDQIYLVLYRNDKKTDILSIYIATSGECIHTIKLTYPGYVPEMFTIKTMHDKPHYVILVDAEKSSIFNIKEKKFIRSISKWNGLLTKDDKFGICAPTRGGLDLIELKGGAKVKTFIPKVAEGVFDVDALLTPNDKHIIYYHSGKRTIRVYNVETTRCIANYKSAARVRCIVCAQDSKSVIFGCEDGTVNMLIIADPMYEDYVDYLRLWRADQMNLFGREGFFFS
jgi:NACHT domain- and WD repeat-containing protein